MSPEERATRVAQAEWDRRRVIDYAATVDVKVTDEPGGDLIEVVNELYLAARASA